MTKLTDELLAEGMTEAAVARTVQRGHTGDGWCASCSNCVMADEPCGGTHGFCSQCDVLVINARAYPLAPDTLCGAISDTFGTGSCVFLTHLGGGPHSWEIR